MFKFDWLSKHKGESKSAKLPPTELASESVNPTPESVETLDPTEAEVAQAEQAIQQCIIEAGAAWQELKPLLEDTQHITDNPEAQTELLEYQKEAQAAVATTLKKISEQLGSNPGGWYENSETQERFYIKFYHNPDQARVEFIANAVYQKLGLAAVRSELFEMDGKLAIASAEIPGGERVTAQEMSESPEVRQGFVADAYLANWDVVGLVYDNIVRSQDGHFCRIDNGGSLVFRAQGGEKDFSPDNIPELTSMLNKNYPAGKVFGDMPEAELKEQAQQIIKKLTPQDIEQIISDSGVSGELAETIRAGLLGRREFLIKKFELVTEKKKEKQLGAQRIAIAQEKLIAQQEQLKNLELYPRVTILADRNLIENQEVNFIQTTKKDDPALPEGSIRVQFKLTSEHWQKIATDYNKRWVNGQSGSLDLTAHEKQAPTIDSIRYGEYHLVDCYTEEINGAQLKIPHQEDYQYINNENKRSALGLVEIILPPNQAVSPEEIYKTVNTILEDTLEIHDGLTAPPAEAEVEYKKARYAWHHKLDQAPAEIEEKLVRTEVAPNYFTFTEPGKHTEYQSLAHYAIYHSIEGKNFSVLAKIFQAGGILSTHERYRRGLFVGGMSSDQDINTGGADNVFTRRVSVETLKKVDLETLSLDGVMLVFNPNILDRTDWFAYTEDRYGSTAEDKFNERCDPETFMDPEKTAWRENNEIMFRTAISSSDIQAISCSRPENMIDVYSSLMQNGITEINGQSLNDFIKHTNRFSDLVKLADKQPLENDELRYLPDVIAEALTEQRQKFESIKELPQLDPEIVTAIREAFIPTNGKSENESTQALCSDFVNNHLPKIMSFRFRNAGLFRNFRPEFITSAEREVAQHILEINQKVIVDLADVFKAAIKEDDSYSGQLIVTTLGKYQVVDDALSDSTYTSSLLFLGNEISSMLEKLQNTVSIVAEIAAVAPEAQAA